MCELCVKIKENCWAEIRDLMNYNRKVNGPLSEAIKERIAEISDDDPEIPEDILANNVEAIRAQMIAERCVFIARACPGSMHHGDPPSVIAGVWAGDIMKKEIQAMHSGSGFLASSLLTMLFGNLDEENDDD